MKTLKQILLTLVILSAFGLSSCKKEEKVIKEESENQILSLLNFASFKTTATGSGTYDYGFVFVPKVNGSVTALSVLMPELDIYAITLWDSTSKTVLATENINNLNTEGPNTKSINAVAVSSGKPYVITVKSVNKKWFEFRPVTGGNINYPLKGKYLNVTGYLWVGSNLADPPKFPINKDITYAAGLADFTFRPE